MTTNYEFVDVPERRYLSLEDYEAVLKATNGIGYDFNKNHYLIRPKDLKQLINNAIQLHDHYLRLEQA